LRIEIGGAQERLAGGRVLLGRLVGPGETEHGAVVQGRARHVGVEQERDGLGVAVGVEEGEAGRELREPRAFAARMGAGHRAQRLERRVVVGPARDAQRRAQLGLGGVLRSRLHPEGAGRTVASRGRGQQRRDGPGGGVRTHHARRRMSDV
jgi:hypothetical protein